MMTASMEENLNKLGISIVTHGGLRTLRIENKFAEGEVALAGAHVLSYIPAGGTDLLWLSEKSFFEEGKPIRGGIPVCWPWFGPAAQPAHGTARISEWSLAEAESEADGSTTLLLTLDESARYGLKAEMKINIGPSLTMEFTTANVSDKPYSLTQALHTYFAISDISDVRVSGLNACGYLDKVAGGTRCVQEGDIVFSGETDRVFDTSDGILLLRDAVRTVKLERFGSHTAVVWNPWIEKSCKMPDFGDEEYHGMVCVEAANAGGDARVIPPGGTHALGLRMTVLSL